MALKIFCRALLLILLIGITAASVTGNSKSLFTKKNRHPDMMLARERIAALRDHYNDDSLSSCIGEFERCPRTHDCVLISKYCGTCAAGMYLCPDRKTCVAQFHTCPNLKGTFWDWTLPIDVRVELLANLTTTAQQSSRLAYLADSIPELYVPAYNFLNDDLHGLRRHRATSFPNGNGLGATWSPETLGEVGRAIGDEARAIHHFLTQQGLRGMIGYHNGYGMTIYAPNVNLVRDPRWGRAQEVYSEDPCLTSLLTVSYVRGMQTRQRGYMQAGACCKHFAVYDLESFPVARYFYNAVTDGRNLWETYMPAFEACAREAGGSHVMCSYNAINGIPACAQGPLMNGVLRDRWNWTGFVVSDYDAWAQIEQTHHYCPNMTCAAAVGINAGMDQEGGGLVAIDHLPNAIAAGLVTAARVRQAFMRNYRLRFELGMFDPPEFVPFAAVPYHTLQSSKHMQLALRAALESIGLYKNDRNVLPLVPPSPDAKTTPKKIAVIGPKAASTAWLQGNYADYPTHGVVSVLEGITNANCGGPRNCIFDDLGVSYNLNNDTYVEAASPEACCAVCNGDLSCNYFTYRDGKCFLLGNPFARTVTTQNNIWSGARFGLCLMTYGISYATITDASVPSEDSRECCQRCRANSSCIRWTYDGISRRCFINPTASNPSQEEDFISGTPSMRVPSVTFEPACTDGELCLDTSGFPAALQSAGTADVVVLVLGLGQQIESEGNDRQTIDLPVNMYALGNKVKQSVRVGTPVIGVFVHGGTIAFKNLLNDLDAIIDAWYPSQQGGKAIADVLFGYYSPASRATVTYYTANSDLPPNLAQQDLYANSSSSYLGLTYRYYKGNVTIPFGFGLTYTQFEYSGLVLKPEKITKKCEPISVSITVRNAGNVTSDEVVQVYVQQNGRAGVFPAPNLRLAAFKRLYGMTPGEVRTEILTLPPKFRAVVNQSEADPILGSEIITVPGPIIISVGPGQPTYTPSALSRSIEVLVQDRLSDCP